MKPYNDVLAARSRAKVVSNEGPFVRVHASNFVPPSSTSTQTYVGLCVHFYRPFFPPTKWALLGSPGRSGAHKQSLEKMFSSFRPNEHFWSDSILKRPKPLWGVITQFIYKPRRSFFRLRFISHANGFFHTFFIISAEKKFLLSFFREQCGATSRYPARSNSRIAISLNQIDPSQLDNDGSFRSRCRSFWGEAEKEFFSPATMITMIWRVLKYWTAR